MFFRSTNSVTLRNKNSNIIFQTKYTKKTKSIWKKPPFDPLELTSWKMKVSYFYNHEQTKQGELHNQCPWLFSGDTKEMKSCFRIFFFFFAIEKNYRNNEIWNIKEPENRWIKKGQCYPVLWRYWLRSNKWTDKKLDCVLVVPQNAINYIQK